MNPEKYPNNCQGSVFVSIVCPTLVNRVISNVTLSLGPGLTL
jgi:hypothetical protein